MYICVCAQCICVCNKFQRVYMCICMYIFYFIYKYVSHIYEKLDRISEKKCLVFFKDKLE